MPHYPVSLMIRIVCVPTAPHSHQSSTPFLTMQAVKSQQEAALATLKRTFEFILLLYHSKMQANHTTTSYSSAVTRH